jgi:hypothetical protein
VFTLFGYRAIGPVHGLLMVLAALIFKVFVVDKGEDVATPRVTVEIH